MGTMDNLIDGFFSLVRLFLVMSSRVKGLPKIGGHPRGFVGLSTEL